MVDPWVGLLIATCVRALADSRLGYWVDADAWREAIQGLWPYESVSVDDVVSKVVSDESFMDVFLNILMEVGGNGRAGAKRVLEVPNAGATC